MSTERHPDPMGQDEYAEKASGLTDADRSIWDCKCGHDASGEHNGLGCYGRISYQPLVVCGCKRTDDDYEDTVERNVAARVAEARAEAWDKGFEAGWAAQDPDNHAPNPYREGADR